MTKLVWDAAGDHLYETGVDRMALYTMKDTGGYNAGVPWNGVISVSENPSGGEPTALYADNIKYLNLISAEDWGCTIEAYTYPDEFAECDGTAEVATGVNIYQQTRKPFGFAYRTKIGNDLVQDGLGYKYHLVYNALAKPTGKSYSTTNETPEAITFSWEVTTTPVEVQGHQPTAVLTIDSTKVAAAKLTALEELLFGSDDKEPTLPLPSAIITLLGGA